MATKKESTGSIEVIEVEQESATFYIRGTTPLICNRMSQKAKGELLFPAGRKNAAERATTLKHKPHDEFRASPYVLGSPDAPTYLAALAVWFKRAMGTAALDMPGTNKAQIGRNIRVEGERIPLYGIPQLHMAVTRSADINRTPDVRTRATLAEWATAITVTYTVPILRAAMVARLLASAGMTIGVGDWRQEKGSGSYGLFSIVSSDDPDWHRIVRSGGRDMQLAAMASPTPYDDETEEMLTWFTEELKALQVRGLAPHDPPVFANGAAELEEVEA